jgi:hypothetical protein
MEKFKSRYRELSVNTGKKIIHFHDHEYSTNDSHEIAYLKKNQGADYSCISEPSEKQDIQRLRVQARDLGYEGDLLTAKKDDLIQFIESKK